MNNPFARRTGRSAAGSSNANGAVNGRVRGLLERLSPRQRQYATLVAILVSGVGLLWLIFALTDTRSKAADAKAAGNGTPSAVTNIGVMPPGQQVNPVDQWVGTAGRKLAQYESERDEQTRLNKDRQAFEAQTMKRFAELEQRLTSASQTANAQPVPAPPPVQAPAAPARPPAASLPPPPPPRTSPVGGMPPGDPGMGLRELPRSYSIRHRR